MYKSFFKLQSSPFGTSPDPRFLYMMPHTREALACLEYGISARKGFTVLSGVVGTGKTTLLRRALASFSNRRACHAYQVRHAAAAESLADRALPHGGDLRRSR